MSEDRACPPFRDARDMTPTAGPLSWPWPDPTHRLRLIRDSLRCAWALILLGACATRASQSELYDHPGIQRAADDLLAYVRPSPETVIVQGVACNAL